MNPWDAVPSNINSNINSNSNAYLTEQWMSGLWQIQAAGNPSGE